MKDHTTPGPWRVRETPESSHQDYVVEQDREDRKTSIASVYRIGAWVDPANARLIAAAPALRDALKEAEAFLSESFGHANAPHDAGGLALLHVVQAALKRAGAL